MGRYKSFQTKWMAMALLGGFLAPALFAQVPGADRDSWVRFPVKSNAEPIQVPKNKPEPAPKPSPSEQPSARAESSESVAEAVDETPHKGWIQFPLRSRAPAAVAAKKVPPAEVEQVKAPNGKINDFVLKGNDSLATKEIAQALKPQKGQEISNDSLQQITDTVSEVYRQNGRLALVELPEQDLTNGVVRIDVTEARFAGVVVEDPQQQLSHNPHLPEKMIEAKMPKGEVLSLSQLDQAAAFLNEIPGMTIGVSLKPGDHPGETQAVATVEPGPKVQGQAVVDNAGATATGAIRENFKFNVNDPLKIGDAASLQLMHSLGLEYEKLTYSVPVGANGWRLGANVSSTNYQVVASELQYLNAKGPSATQGVDLTIPLVRDVQNSATLVLAADQRQFKNEALEVIQSNYKGTTESAYVELAHKSPVGSETTASAQLVLGNIDMSGSTLQQQQSDALTTQTAGDYKKVKLSLSHKEPIDVTNTWVVSAQAQWANKNLDSSEKMFLGGAQGVRAYPANEAGGSEGDLLSMEWQKILTMNNHPLTAAGFYDIGHVVINKNNNFVNASNLNDYTLKGFGFWVGVTEMNRFGPLSLRLTVSHRLGINPGASSTTGLDQDGTRQLTRFWLSLMQSF